MTSRTSTTRLLAPLALVLSLGLAALGGCGGGAKTSGGGGSHATTTTGAMLDGDFAVVCGCAVEDIGTCGNYVVVEGETLALEYPGLGEMEFCGREGLHAHLHGTRRDGRLVATAYTLHE